MGLSFGVVSHNRTRQEGTGFAPVVRRGRAGPAGTKTRRKSELGTAGGPFWIAAGVGRLTIAIFR